MPARNGIRRRLKLLPVVALAMVAMPVASAAAQAPGLPRTFDVTRIDSVAAVNGGAFGWGLWSADLTGDGKQDLLVAQGQQGTAAVPTQVMIYDGATGAHIDTILPPEDNPLEPPAPPAGTGPIAPAPATLYSSPELAFVYVETMPDIGSCPGGDGPDAGKICDAALIGPGDGIPEIVVGARALRVNATNGATPATFNDPKIGRGYVIDGKTRAVLKRIDMPQVDRAAFLARNPPRRDGVPTSTAAFGRTMASPQGLPPCAGLASENNDTGVGACPALTRGTGTTTSGAATITSVNLPDATNGQMIVGPGIPRATRIRAGAGTATLTISANATATATGVALEASDPRYPQAVRIGDIDGGGTPDIVVTSRGFSETPGPLGTAAVGSECKTNTTNTTNCGAGKIWTYRGEAIAGTSPQTILDTPHQSIQNPNAQAPPAGGEYGGNLFRVGDIVGPTTASPLPDGIPDYVISFRGSDLPLGAPDLQGGLNAGSADLFSGATGNRIRTLISPEPQQRSTFSGGFNAGRSVGDLGATDTDDILLGAPFQNLQYADQGRLWVFNGDSTAGGGGEQSFNFSMLNDPEPYIGGNFGGSQTGVGDIVGGPGAPANEVLVAGFRFDNFTEASQNTVPDLNFMNATLDKNLMTIPHPEGKTGDGFGVGLTPMGDINGDGFLDFAASAYFADGPFGGQGRAWIFNSNNSPLPPPPTAPAPAAAGPTTPATEKEALKAGACTNRAVGTDVAEKMDGTLAGDEIFGFAGNDTINGFAGRDCIDGQGGDDTLRGDDDNDKVIGGNGADKIYGGDDRDELFGGTGTDRLLGGFGRDMLAGGAGNDYIHGGPDADRLFGEAGTDRIIGGGGRNQIDGGGGNDSIDARNGERDRIVCGLGRDTVRADRFDRLNGCEVVRLGGKITNRKELPPRAVASSAGSSSGRSR